jgi:hypothetical protein
MHHEQDLDYERDDLRRREDDWGYGERARYERERMSGRRYGSEGYGGERYGRQRYGREGMMPGAGGPYGESYEREASYDRPWEDDRRGGYERRRGYDRSRGYERSGMYERPRHYDRDQDYGREPEAPNEMRRPYGEGRHVQYDRLAPAVRRGSWGGRVGEGYGSRSSEQRLGQYSGRGPKGYTRSSERILEDVAERLTDDPEVDASEIEVAVDGDVVVLRGKVYDRAQKRAAEDVVENVSGVRDVRNELQVEKGMLQELTDAVTGRSDDEEQRGSRTPPRQTRVS